MICRYMSQVGLFLSLWLVAVGASAREVAIRIVGNGGGAQYVEENKDAQEPVSVAVGDTVIWANEGNRTHTATAENEQGDALFDTGDISPSAQSDPVTITAELFSLAGGVAGASVSVDYFCDHHSQMASSLLISLPNGDDTETAESIVSGGQGLVRQRRDITRLSNAELTSYRDAWRRMQNNGSYSRIAGNHGCPDGYCHRPGEGVLFLPWHREYLLRLEAALGEPVHYWDWTAPAAAATGIPTAFVASTYRGADGNLYPNPLQAFRFTCPRGSSPQTTFRNPRAPFLLSQYAGQVRTAYRLRTYSDFNASIESPPHDNVHGWVGGRMGNITYAAYDPVFWAHHANVDRQWASWQRSGGADPTSNQLTRPLTGFTGRRVQDVVRIDRLGYSYDRFDSVVRGRPLVLAQAEKPRSELQASATETKGVGKTFTLSTPLTAARKGQATGPLDLVVSGIPAHSDKSYFVYVFLNQPDATPDDAKPDNPHFAGTFSVFGGAPAKEVRTGAHQPAVARSVMELFAANQPRLTDEISQVTLVATDETGAVVAQRDMPFDAVSIRGGKTPVEPPTEDAEGTKEAESFTGTSADESYDEAYRDAVNQAQASLTADHPDAEIMVEVVSVEGKRGGISGRRELSVKILAWRN